MSLCWSCWSLMINIMSKRDKIVGMKSMLSSPFVSSQRPNTELAAASTEQREFKVVVMPAWKKLLYFMLFCFIDEKNSFLNWCYLSNWDGLLLHSLMDGDSVVLSHLSKLVQFSKDGKNLAWTQTYKPSAVKRASYFIKLVNAYHAAVSQDHGPALHDEPTGGGIPQHRGR